MQNLPLVSIIIVTWNSELNLSNCLDKIAAQKLKSFEVIIVDNGSNDSAIERVQTIYSDFDLWIEKLGSNTGFAAANNLGARLARGQWLALLNADAFPEPDWLERLLEAAKMCPNACFASRQLQSNDPRFLDGEGDIYHVSGLVWRRNYGFPVYEKRGLEEIFSPCAAAALYPRQAFLEAGGFDEDYFSYQEDVDLGFRLRLMGLRCFYVPQAVVHHVGSASTGKHSDFAIYHGHRNLEWTYVKNMPTPLFWIFLPVHLVADFFMILKFIFMGHGKAIWRAKVDAIRGLSKMLDKRKAIQKDRRVPIMEIYRLMEHGLLAPFLTSLQRRRFGKH